MTGTGEPGDTGSPPAAVERARRTLSGSLMGLLGIEFGAIGRGCARARLQLRPQLLAPNGYLHGGTVVALADSCCGFGTLASLPAGAESFTTIELKTNFLATARDGTILCEARLVHAGRRTQVWDAEVRAEDSGRVLAAFRCTQMILYPRSPE